MMHLNLDHSQAKQAQQSRGLTMKLRCMILVWTLFYFNVDQTNANASEGKFFRIFNGKTLEGWSPSFPQASEAWYVRDEYSIHRRLLHLSQRKNLLIMNIYRMNLLPTFTLPRQFKYIPRTTI